MVKKIATISTSEIEQSKPEEFFPDSSIHALTYLFYACFLENASPLISSQGPVRITKWHAECAIAKIQASYLLCLLNRPLQKTLDAFEQMHEEEREWREKANKAEIKKAQIAFETRKQSIRSEEIFKQTQRLKRVHFS